MKIAVIGATGRVGGLIVDEALSRDYNVTAIVRNARKVEKDIPVIEKEITDLASDDLTSFDAVVDAFGVWDESKFDQYVTTTEHLCDILAGSQTRLLVVGGFASLYTDSSHTEQGYQQMPVQYRALPEALADSLAVLRKTDDVRWTYVSPASSFDAEGERTGKYQLGGSEVMLNSEGESYVSYADYAIAMVDLLANDDHVKEQVSVVSE